MSLAPGIAHAGRSASRAYLVGASVFATTVVLLYLGSTLYHALPPGKAKRVFRVLEHSAIYLLIAGTYTPFTLGALRGPWGWSLLALVWGVGFYVAKRLRYGHFVWHLCVLAGTVCHFVAVRFYAG